MSYKVELYDPRSGGFMPSSPGIGMHVEVKDPDDKIVLSRVSLVTFEYFAITLCFLDEFDGRTMRRSITLILADKMSDF